MASLDFEPSKTFSSEGKKDTYPNAFVTVLVTAASAIGFGNVWRFPYLTFEHGGLMFIIIYIVVLVFFAYPLVALELGLGQILRGGQIKTFSFVSPHGRAPSLSAWTTFTIALYYQLLLVWCLVFFFNSFSGNFPWANPPEWKSECGLKPTQEACVQLPYCEWKSTFCAMDGLYNSREFFRETGNVYNDFGGRDKNIKITNISGINVLYFFGTWVLIFFCVFAGGRILGYTTYVTMGLPAVLLFVLAIITATYDGAGQGIIEYIGKFKVSAFTNRAILDAASQATFSLSLGQGCLTALGSHARRNENFVLNGLFLTIADTFAALISGFAVFSVVGFLAKQSKQSISDLPISGIALAFTTYPAAVAEIPGVMSHFTSALFFFVLWLLGFSTLCTLIEGLVVSVQESAIGERFKMTRVWLTFSFCAFMFLVPGLLLSTNIGFSLLDNFDMFNSITQAFTAGSQAIAISWFHLVPHVIERTGSLAFYVHSITFFAGAALFGILDKVNNLAAFIVGLAVAACGLFAAVSLYKPQTVPDTVELKNISFKERMYDLTVYNVEGVRSFFNKGFNPQDKVRLPMLWSISIKYIVPYVTFYLFVSGITDKYKIYQRPLPDSYYPFYIFAICAISPILMVLTMIFVTIFPKYIEPFMAPNIHTYKLLGEQELLEQESTKVEKC